MSAHVSGIWCTDLHCARCYSADTWQKSELAAVRASLTTIAEVLGVEPEPHQTFSERLQASVRGLKDLEKENFALGAGQCIVDGGLCGDEYGNQYCKIVRERDAAQAEADGFRNLARKALDAIEEIHTDRCSGWCGYRELRAAIKAALNAAIKRAR